MLNVVAFPTVFIIFPVEINWYTSVFPIQLKKKYPSICLHERLFVPGRNKNVCAWKEQK